MRWLWRGVAVVAISWVGLLVSDRGVLVSERRIVAGGLGVEVPGYGDIGPASQDRLDCRYFTGRGVIAVVFWYSPNGFFGRAACPFMSDPR